MSENLQLLAKENNVKETEIVTIMRKLLGQNKWMVIVSRPCQQIRLKKAQRAPNQLISPAENCVLIGVMLRFGSLQWKVAFKNHWKKKTCNKVLWCPPAAEASPSTYDRASPTPIGHKAERASGVFASPQCTQETLDRRMRESLNENHLKYVNLPMNKFKF